MTASWSVGFCARGVVASGLRCKVLGLGVKSSESELCRW